MQSRLVMFVGFVASQLFTACLSEPSQAVSSSELAEYGDAEYGSIPPPDPLPPPGPGQPPFPIPTQPGHNYPPPPPGHDPDGPYQPAPLYPCLSCHRPSSPLPPLPAQCTRCHKITAPRDPHNGMYPPGQGPDFEPGDAPVPDFCLDCHRIKPKPIVLLDAQAIE